MVALVKSICGIFLFLIRMLNGFLQSILSALGILKLVLFFVFIIGLSSFLGLNNSHYATQHANTLTHVQKADSYHILGKQFITETDSSTTHSFFKDKLSNIVSSYITEDLKHTTLDSINTLRESFNTNQTPNALITSRPLPQDRTDFINKSMAYTMGNVVSGGMMPMSYQEHMRSIVTYGDELQDDNLAMTGTNQAEQNVLSKSSAPSPERNTSTLLAAKQSANSQMQSRSISEDSEMTVSDTSTAHNVKPKSIGELISRERVSLAQNYQRTIQVDRGLQQTEVYAQNK